jgi:L-ascorbate metabolism protein UlaG (beta-lactamase superfamily)
MNIFWLGQTCFKLETSNQGKEKLTVLIDPFSEKVGLKLPKMTPDILLITNKEKTSTEGLSGDYFLIDGPGEYEIKNLFVKGIYSAGQNTIYFLQSEDLKICHLGYFQQESLTQEQLEEIGKVDILMIPVGGGSFLSPQKAVDILNQIEPSIVIPMLYSLPKLKIKLEGVEKFLKAFGISSLEPLPKLSIKKKDISEDEARIVILKP